MNMVASSKVARLRTLGICRVRLGPTHQLLCPRAPQNLCWSPHSICPSFLTRSLSVSSSRYVPGNAEVSTTDLDGGMDKSVQEKDATAVDATNTMIAPYAEQNPEVIAQLCSTLEKASKDKKKTAGFSVKKTVYTIAGSRDGLTVDSWKYNDFEYKKRRLPTYARGLFTTKTREDVLEIAVRGYDKFFNINEVPETKWKKIETQTTGPYDLTLKENGCIIFISGLDDGTLLICSKHSTGDRKDVEMSHAGVGERWIEKQLQKLGRTKEDLARELRQRNATAVAELCDDEFEEHILPYGPDEAGLYLHGININIPEFMTYSSALVHQFADDWGFRKIGVITMNTVAEVKKFLEECAETGAYEGRAIEGFVVRCKRSDHPSNVQPCDWFFKYKFEEPYLMYRQWRECTKDLIAGKPPRIRKHRRITEEYLLFAKKRLAADPRLAELYNKNHGIITMRNDFLASKRIDGADAAKIEDQDGNRNNSEVEKGVTLVPIATIGCGKTTIAVALMKLFDFGHIQNDNISGSKRPPRFTQAVLEQLKKHPVVTADRNNAEKRERKQIIMDIKARHNDARLVALNFVHDDINQVREVTQNRVLARGDNHQTIQAATNPDKAKTIMNEFLSRFEPLDAEENPDDGFDLVIDLDPVAGSRKNLEAVISTLKSHYPKLIAKMPTAEEMDSAIQEALKEYSPNLRHTIPERHKTGKNDHRGQQARPQNNQKKKTLQFMSVEVPANDIVNLLEKTFASVDAEKSQFYKELQHNGRIQEKFHVTLIHRASSKDHPELWERYQKLQADKEASTGVADAALGECEVVMERVVHDDRIMAIVVRLDDPENQWDCVNSIAHITIGTRDHTIKPKESNDLLMRWVEEGVGGKIAQIGFETRPSVKGIVKPVLSR